MKLMKTHTISVLEMALEGEIQVTYLAQKLGMDSWEVQRHIGILRKQRYVSLDDSFVRLRNSEKVRLLVDLSKGTDVKKILHESNEIVLSFLTEPVTKDDLIKNTGLSRATVYRALKDFNELGIIKKTIYGIQLTEANQPVIEFAEFLESERKKLEELI